MPGSLIQLQGPGLLDQFYFVGLAMKRPQQHVLVKGFHVEESSTVTKVCILPEGMEAPIMVTSHQMFERILTQKGPQCDSLDEISFIVHEYDLNPFQPLLCVRCTSASAEHCFMSKKREALRRKSATKSSGKLGFGLKTTPKKRKRKPPAAQNGQQGQQAKKKCSQSQRVNVSSISQKLEKFAKDEVVSSGSEQADPSSPSSSSSSSTGGDSSASNSDSDQSVQSKVEEIEEPFLTPDAQREEDQIDSILASHLELAEKQGRPEGGVVSSDSAAPERPSSSSNVQSRVAEPVPRKEPSFCEKVLGLIEVGSQVAAKLAKCRHCTQKIERHSARFAYAFNRSKWAGWIHPDCLPQYLADQKADLAQARSFLQEQLQREHAPHIMDAVRKVQKELANM